MNEIILSDEEKKFLYGIVKSELERASELYKFYSNNNSDVSVRFLVEHLNLKVISLTRVLFKLHNFERM